MSVLAASTLTAVILFGCWRRSGWGLVDYLGIGLVYLYARLWHRWSSRGPAPLPASGPALLVANHTCSADPAFLTAGCARRLSFVLAREFYANPLARRLFEFIHCVPVTRNGRDVRAARECLRRLEEGRVVCIFPEGGLSNAGRRGRLAGKPGVALLALRSQAPVFVAHISGGPQTSSLQRAWLHPSRVRVTFGDALDLSRFHQRPIDRQLLEEVTQVIMDAILRLGERETRKSGR